MGQTKCLPLNNDLLAATAKSIAKAAAEEQDKNDPDTTVVITVIAGTEEAVSASAERKQNDQPDQRTAVIISSEKTTGTSFAVTSVVTITATVGSSNITHKKPPNILLHTSSYVRGFDSATNGSGN